VAGRAILIKDRPDIPAEIHGLAIKTGKPWGGMGPAHPDNPSRHERNGYDSEATLANWSQTKHRQVLDHKWPASRT
jgi:hypothetical protein